MRLGGLRQVQCKAATAVGPGGATQVLAQPVGGDGANHRVVDRDFEHDAAVGRTQVHRPALDPAGVRHVEAAGVAEVGGREGDRRRWHDKAANPQREPRGAAGHQQCADRQAILPRVGAWLAVAQGLADNGSTIQQLDADDVGEKRRGGEIALQHKTVQRRRFSLKRIDRRELQRQAKQGLAGRHGQKIDETGQEVPRQIPAQVAGRAPAGRQPHNILNDTAHRHGDVVA